MSDKAKSEPPLEGLTSGRFYRTGDQAVRTSGHFYRTGDQAVRTSGHFYRTGDQAGRTSVHFYRTANTRLVHGIPFENGKSLVYVFAWEVTNVNAALLSESLKSQSKPRRRNSQRKEANTVSNCSTYSWLSMHYDMKGKRTHFEIAGGSPVVESLSYRESTGKVFCLHLHSTSQYSVWIEFHLCWETKEIVIGSDDI